MDSVDIRVNTGLRDASASKNRKNIKKDKKLPTPGKVPQARGRMCANVELYEWLQKFIEFK